MKKIAIALFMMLGYISFAQSIDYNTKKGYAINGYDVVAYFDGNAINGSKEFSTQYDGVNFKFSSQENKDKFTANPSQYIPQYGGYCAFAVAKSGRKVSVNPETFEIRDGKLYLFYNSGGTNTLQLWTDQSPKDLQVIADKNWQTIKNK
ncbi:YHS domain-containing (seleno)protein [Flagellimonas sp. W118]|uniref:YHS domain-containing (seleno)protein n=1 Tax=Flagellimonas sp. W118 TaxID=3410791 RepID=UPI003BF566B0